MIPLKVTAIPQVGIATDRTLPLDGVLFHYAMRDAYGKQHVTYSGRKSDNPDVLMPIKRINTERDDWFYASSYAQWDCPHEETQYWHKRFDTKQSDLVDFGKKRGNVLTEEGKFKAMRMPVNVIHARSVSWYCVADEQWMRAMVQRITHMGKKRGQGDGAILEWIVEPIEDDWSVYRDGQLMRCIPSGTNEGLFVGYRPSYWMPENQTLCHVP